MQGFWNTFQQDGVTRALWLVFSRGGFVIFVVIGVWLLFKLYLEEIRAQFLGKQEWVFLHITPPKVNLQSSLAVEQVYVQMHSLLSIINFPAKYVEGKVQLWYSLELVSLGGKINYIIRTPKKTREVVEAAIYSEYPNAEITEVSDYLGNLEYSGEDSAIELSGTEFKMATDQAIPLRSYKDFEHMAAEDKIIDPLKPALEAMTKLDPHELYAVQVLVAPIIDTAWIKSSEAKVKELIEGKKKEDKQNFWVASAKQLGQQIIVLFGGKPAEEIKEEKRDITKLTDVEKLRVNLVLNKITKPGYLTKIRHIFIAPKDQFNSDRPGVVGSAYRTFGSPYTNQLFPDGETGTKPPYKISETLEKPYLDYVARRRKKELFRNFKSRDFYEGTKPFVLNTEELATLYHLPILPEEVTRVPLETVESKKSQPPLDLPLGDY